MTAILDPKTQTSTQVTSLRTLNSKSPTKREPLGPLPSGHQAPERLIEPARGTPNPYISPLVEPGPATPLSGAWFPPKPEGSTRPKVSGGPPPSLEHQSAEADLGSSFGACG